MQHHGGYAGMRSASQREESSDDDEYYIDAAMVSFRQDTDSSGPEIDSDEDVPARETLTASAYGRRPPDQQSKVPRLPKKFVESPAANKDHDPQQDIRMSGRGGRGRGKPLSAPNQQTDTVAVNANAENVAGRQGTYDAASQQEMQEKEAGNHPHWLFFNVDKPKDPREDLNIQSEESFPSLSSSINRTDKCLVSNRNTELPTGPRPLKSSLDVSGFSDQAAAKEESNTPGLASSALAEDDGRAWCLTEPYCIQFDGLPVNVACSKIEEVCSAFGVIKASEKRVQRTAEVASVRIRYEKEGSLVWALDVMKDSPDGILSAEEHKNYSITVKRIDA